MTTPHVRRVQPRRDTENSFPQRLGYLCVVASVVLPLGCAIEATGSESHFACQRNPDCPIGVCERGYCEYEGARYEREDVPSAPAPETVRDSGVDSSDASSVARDASSEAPARDSGVRESSDAAPAECKIPFEEAADRSFAVLAEAEADGFSMSCLVRFFDEAGPTGIPFVREVLAFSDAATTFTVTNPEPGRVCMSGTTAEPGADGEYWGATLILQVADMNEEDHVVDAPFDAASLGIESFTFTLTTPPSPGVGLGLATVTDPSCPEFVCNEGGSFRRMAEGYPVAYSTSDNYAVNLVNFEHPPWAPSTVELDLGSIMAFELFVSTTAGSKDYDFCIEDFIFFDAEQNVVVPLD